ncbi:MAG TPA: N-formylglutamate amidohydrolase [Candidatus Cloacimonadota bacterium]|jgi:N-formylglutamate amidohydrolase|nr:N-formylglutamate amidohydrolase [Candidatus Cloacimonadales bacterium]HPY96281.1 N-formylglutamate amidohydrolase [Candidatus Cloacimonadota bacterium]HQB40205.1 N-formylglutamate amidohydrolase [Candidatus Cloacimonadota bacterium]
MTETLFKLNSQNKIVAAAIHAGSYIRKEVGEIIGLNRNILLHEEDPMTDHIAVLFDSFIIQNTSRFEYDTNRPITSAVYQKPQDCWGLEIYPDSIDSDIVLVSENKYREFYKQIDMFFNELCKEHKQIFVWDIHSFNNRGRPDISHEHIDNAVPDMCLGTSNTNPKFHDLFKEIANNITREDYFGKRLSVAFNNPFPGGTFPRYLNANYDGKVIAFTLEINKRIFMKSSEYRFDESDAIIDLRALARLREIIYNQSPLINSNL